MAHRSEQFNPIQTCVVVRIATAGSHYSTGRSLDVNGVYVVLGHSIGVAGPACNGVSWPLGNIGVMWCSTTQSGVNNSHH